MYTQCPECKTIFRLSEEQLALAGGKVRCGHCLGVFTARDHEVDALPEPSPARAAPGQKGAGPAQPDARQRAGSPRSAPATKNPAERSPVRKPASRAELERGIARILSDEAVGTSPPAAAPGQPPARNPGAPAVGAGKPEQSAAESLPPRRPPQGSNHPPHPNPEPKESAKGLDAPAPGRKPGPAAGSPGPEVDPTAGAGARNESAAPKAETARETAGDSEPRRVPKSADESVVPERSRPDADPTPSDPEELSPTDDAAGSDPAAAERAELHFSAAGQSGAEDQDVPLPAALRQPERRGSSPLAVIFWSLASLLMLALLGAQYAYYERYDLAGNPTYRPWLEQMCRYLDCRLPARRDAAAFQLQERDVRYHPDYAGALLISGTFVNGADFAQPYPTVEVLLKDVNGEVVASRRFAPAEYLHNNQAPSALLEPGTEAHLLLEVSDPGNQAVSFEFHFM